MTEEPHGGTEEPQEGTEEPQDAVGQHPEPQPPQPAQLFRPPQPPQLQSPQPYPQPPQPPRQGPQLPPDWTGASLPPIAPYPPPPPAPLPPADRWRAAAAGLLNLSGLGLGYALLRRWRSATLCWIATGILLMIALPATPSGVPGLVLIVYLLSLVLVAVRAALRGLRTPLTWPPRSQTAFGLAIVMLAVPVGSAVLFNNAQQEAIQKMLLGRLAQADQTIAAAEADPIDTAEPLFTPALTTYQDLLDHHRSSRAAKLVPDRLTAFYQTVGAPFSKDDFCGAIEPLTFLRSLPTTVISAADLGSLARWPDDRLATSLYECGIGALGTGSDTTATTDLNKLLATFPTSGQAAKVEPAVADTIKKTAGGITGSDPCTATTDLTKLGTQVGALTSTEASITAGLKKDSDTVNADVETGTFACAVSDYKGGKFIDAQTAMDTFVTTYPDDPNKALAQKYSIAAQIAQQDADAGNVIPTLTSGGSVSITILNDGPDPIQMLYTGPATGSVDIGACASCKVYASEQDGQNNACSNSSINYPKATFTLPPGTTYFLQKSTDSSVNSSPHSEKYDADSSYEACAYETSIFGGL